MSLSRSKPGAAAVFANLEGELQTLERQMLNGNYGPGRYVAIDAQPSDTNSVLVGSNTPGIGLCDM
jgi:hypothetical protein